MTKSNFLINSVRFGLWSTLGVHMYVGGMKAEAPVLAFVTGLVMFSYAGSIVLETIFRLSKEREDVGKDQKLDVKDELGGLSPSDAKRSEDR